MLRSARLLLALAFAAAPTTLSAQYDPTTSFASGTNPGGPWRYGYKSATMGGFTPYTIYAAGVASARWSDGSTYGGVYYAGNLMLGGGQVAPHPLAGGQLSVLRFVAPTSGSYSFIGAFKYSYLTTTGVYVALNDASILQSGYISSPLSPVTFSNLLSFSAGEYVDFEVGTGGNGYLYDSTLLDLNAKAVPSVVPEPASIALVATGLLGLFAVSRKRRA